jgi:hypothetical protein
MLVRALLNFYRTQDKPHQPAQDISPCQSKCGMFALCNGLSRLFTPAHSRLMFKYHVCPHIRVSRRPSSQRSHHFRRRHLHHHHIVCFHSHIRRTLYLHSSDNAWVISYCLRSMDTSSLSRQVRLTASRSESTDNVSSTGIGSIFFAQCSVVLLTISDCSVF